MSSVRIYGDSSGSITLSAPTSGTDVTITLPSTTGTIALTSNSSFTGQTSFASGASASPSLTFTGDTNTGLWSPAADTLAVSTGGTERMRIDNAGNVGIGRTAPSGLGGALVNNYTLMPDDGAYVGLGAAFYNGNWRNAVAGWGGSAIRNSGGVFTVFTADSPGGGVAGAALGMSERFRISGAGNVGIGTISPAARLHIEGDTIVSSNTGSKLHLYRFSDTNTAFLSTAANGDVTVTTGTSGTAERMRISATGNVGIGTSSPGSPLTVQANDMGLRIQSTAGSTEAYNIYRKSVDGLLNFDGIQSTGFNGYVFSTTPSAGSLTERMRITNAGNVGIGTATPNELVHARRDANAATISRVVNADAGASADARVIASNGTSDGGLIVRGTGHASAQQLVIFQGSTTAPMTFFVAGTERMRIDNAGLITGTGTSLGAWTAYTPTLDGTGWAIGNGTVTGAYCQIGKIVMYRAALAFGSTTTAGSGPLTLSLPVTAATGTGADNTRVRTYDASTATQYIHDVLPNGTGSFYPVAAAGAAGAVSSYYTTTAPITWATNDVILAVGTYEAA